MGFSDRHFDGSVPHRPLGPRVLTGGRDCLATATLPRGKSVLLGLVGFFFMRQFPAAGTVPLAERGRWGKGFE